MQLNPVAAYLNYQLPTRLSGVLSFYNKMAEQKIPAVLSNFVLPEDSKGVFKANCKHCYKTISGSTKVSTNWLKHMVALQSNSYRYTFSLEELNNMVIC